MSAAHGKSAYTLHKEALFSNCIGYDVRVRSSDFYFVFDLNGGPGINRVENGSIRGSSLIAYDKLRERGQAGAIYACEINRRRAIELNNRLASSVALFSQFNTIHREVVRADNRQFVEKIPSIISSYGITGARARGLIIADPDGMRVPIDGIRAVLKSCPNLSVLMHLSGLERVFAYRRRYPDDSFKAAGSIRSMEEVLNLRRYSLISERLHGNGHYILFLADYPLHSYQPKGCPGLLSTDLPEGIRILDRIQGKGN